MRICMKSTVAAIVSVLVMLGPATVLAHEMEIRGTVAAIESSRIQVRTGEEKKNEMPGWYPIDPKTKVMRGKTVVTLEQAKIVIGERVVLIVDHQADNRMRTLEIRLAESKAT